MTTLDLDRFDRTGSLVDRGVLTMPKDELHELFNSVLAPFETIMVVFIVILIVLLKKLRLYENFPGSLFRWTLFIDLLYAMFIGPFRWLPGNTFYDSMAYPTTESGCITAVLIDTFCQMGLLYTNCLIVAVVFYMVYFGKALGKKTRSDFKRWGMQGFWVITLGVSITTCLGEVHNYVGWCTADSVAVIFKQLVWFILIIMQITMIIPTLVMLYQANRKHTSFATGTLIRFSGIMVTQAMGLFPIIAVEFLGLARKPIPRILMQLIAILFPSAHFIDCVMISIKLWPYFVTRIKESDGNGHCGYIAKIAQRSVVAVSEHDDMDEHSITGSVHTHGTKLNNIVQAYADQHDKNRVYLAEKATDSDDSDDLVLIAQLKRKHKQEMRAKNKENNSDASTSDSEDDEVDLESHGESTMTTSTIMTKQKSFFDKIPFWLHLLLTMSIPFFLLVAVSMIMVLELADTRDKSILIRQDVVFITYISDFLHESQKERGVTGVFMGSGGKTFGCEILAQYRETDFWQERLQFYLNNQFVNVKLVTKSTFLQALIHMLRIPEHRDDVQNLRIPKGDGIGHYSAMNMYFVGIVAEICKTAKLGDDMQHRMFANLAYFSGKEIAGIERAMGSVAFSAGTFGGMGKYRSFVTRVSSQSTHLWFFEVYVNSENSKFEEEEMDNIAVQITELMRQKLLANDGAAMIAQDGGEWFNNMTLRINILRKVETLMAMQLKEEAQIVVDNSTTGMMNVVIILAVVLVIDGLMILGLAKTSAHVDKFSAALARKRSDVKVSQGLIGGVMNYFKNANFVYQVLVPVLLCGLGLLFVSWLLLDQQVRLSQKAAETSENTHLQFFFSNFIHESQKERGATGVYMGSNGQKFQTQLDNQKQITDFQKRILFMFLDEYVDYMNLMDTNYFIEIMTAMGRMRNHRINSWLLIIEAGEGIGYYTNMNHNIVLLYNEIAVRASGNSVESRMLGYISFVFMKEKAGNERAVGAGALGQKNGWIGQEASYRKFVNLVSLQATAKYYFKFFGTEADNQLLEQQMQSKGSKVATQWQGDMLEGQVETMKMIDAPYWFGNMTLKINSWRVVETAMNNNLVQMFDVHEDKFTFYKYLIAIMLLVLFLIAFMVSIKGIRLVLASRAYTLYKQRVRGDRLQRKAFFRQKLAVYKESQLDEIRIKGAAILV